MYMLFYIKEQSFSCPCAVLRHSFPKVIVKLQLKAVKKKTKQQPLNAVFPVAETSLYKIYCCLP